MEGMPGAQPQTQSVASTDPMPSGVHEKASSWSSGVRVGDYLLSECIGRGGMAEVWRARPVAGGPAVALKCMHPYLAQEPRCLDMFQYEAALGISFRHPNVVNALAYSEHEGQPYFVMDLIDGPTCADLSRSIRRGGPRLPVAAILHIGLSLLSALEYLHQFGPGGMVHRDVSPGNILCDAAGNVFLTDFGIVLFPHLKSPTERHRVRGKRGYMAPEQLSGVGCDIRADLFSTGLVLSELLLGKQLFGTKNHLRDLIQNYAVDPLPGDPVLSGPIGAVVRRALAHAPSERFASAREMADALSSAAKQLGVRPNPEQLARHVAEVGHSIARWSPGSTPRRSPTPRSGTPPLPRRSLPGRLRVASVLAERFELAARAIVTGRAAVTLDAPALAPVSRLLARPEYAPLPAQLALQPFERARLPSLLFDVWNGRKTGLFLLRGEDGERRVYFRNGIPALITGPDAGDLLGARMVREKIATREQIRHALERSLRAGEPLGETLLASIELVPIDMLRILVAQLADRFVGLGKVDSGQQAFIPGLQSSAVAPRPDIGMPALIARLVRHTFGDAEIDRALYPHIERELPSVRALATEQLGLTREEQGALDLLAQPGALLGRCGAASANLRAFRVAAFVAVSLGS
jgi:serine/threonine protein kinase